MVNKRRKTHTASRIVRELNQETLTPRASAGRRAQELSVGVGILLRWLPRAAEIGSARHHFLGARGPQLWAEGQRR